MESGRFSGPSDHSVQMYHEIPNDLLALLEPLVADHGLELVDAEVSPNAIVRVVVDTRDGDGRVSVERCAELSREIATHLDTRADLAEDYRLEVASPGLNRVLAREKDFVAACGREIKLETAQALGGRKRFRGPLRSFEGGVAEVEVDGEAVRIPLAAVKRAHQIYEFSSADFARESKRKQRRRGGRAARGGRS